MSFSGVEAYKKQRDVLIKEDRKLRREYSTPRSPLEIEADKMMRKLREKEAKTIWKEDTPGIPNRFAGMGFLTAKPLIETTETFKMLQKMPKGAVLHAHLDAAGHPRSLLTFALEYSEVHVRVPEQLNAQNINSILPEFQALRPEDWNLQGPGLTSNLYVPQTWVNIATARREFDLPGGSERFDQWVISSMTISSVEAYETNHTIYKIWRKFDSTFFVTGGLISFMPVFRQYMKEVLWIFIGDGLLYAEPRVLFLDKPMIRENGVDDVTHREMLQTFASVVQEVKDELKKEGKESKFIGARVIYTTTKAVEPDKLDWYTEDCIALKKEFPDLIAGFDLVGDEVELRPITAYVDPLLRFKKRQKDEGVDIPLILHAGETLGDGTAADDNLYDAIMLDTKRIGHGYSSVKHPKIIEICRDRRIAFEVCPVSNDVLGLYPSMPMSHLPILLNHGVPVVLSSDDSAIFGNMGVTYDFFQAFVSSELTGLSTLGALARDSIEFSCMDRDQKTRALAAWEVSWTEYLELIVRECK